MVLARISSTRSWRRRSSVVITLSPGWGICSSPVSGSVYQYSLTTLPLVFSSWIWVPASPRRYSSKAFSSPSTPTLSFML